MILNLTQHPATPEQVAQGVIDLSPALREDLSRLLTVDELPTLAQVRERCAAIAALMHSSHADETPTSAMIGGAPWMMQPLADALRQAGVASVLAAFSRRESVESIDASGAVKKTAVFRHVGFVPL